MIEAIELIYSEYKKTERFERQNHCASDSKFIVSGGEDQVVNVWTPEGPLASYGTRSVDISPNGMDSLL